MSARVEVYREQDWTGSNNNPTYKPGKWRWRFISNGRVMADSGQGYSRRIDALTGCATVLGGVTGSDDRDWPTTCIARNDIFGTRVLVPVVDLTREAKP